MSKRENNAERVITGCYVNSFHAHKKDALRLNKDKEITDNGTVIGKFVEFYSDRHEEYRQFLVLSMIDYKSQPTGKLHKKQLIEAARAQGLAVIFVPELDIGFGVIKYPFVDIQRVYLDCIKVAKNSSDDVKTSCCAIDIDGNIIAYTYNQRLYGDEEYYHAETILCDYIDYLEYSQDIPVIKYGYTFVSLLEPCEKCVRRIIANSGRKIYYAHLHKDKWNTYEYMQLVNDLGTREVTSLFGLPMQYIRFKNDKVEKFYEQ